MRKREKKQPTRKSKIIKTVISVLLIVVMDCGNCGSEYNFDGKQSYGKCHDGGE